MKDWPLYFGLTVALEGILCLLLNLKLQTTFKNKLKNILGVNLATHPIVFGLSVSGYWPFGLIPLELFAVGTEAVLYQKFGSLKRADAWGVSFLCNGFSLGAGTLILRYFDVS